jgi:hypothetical protein
MKLAVVIALLGLSACVSPTPYQRTTIDWTRKGKIRGAYQEAMQLAAIYKSPSWRIAHAERDAASRGLGGPAREQRLAQAQADATGPIEFQLIVTTWDRRENDLDRGERSVWRVRMIDDTGGEILPLEVVRDKRPQLVVRAEYPSMGDFSVAYVAKFPRKVDPQLVRLRVSGPRGGVELQWPGR